MRALVLIFLESGFYERASLTVKDSHLVTMQLARCQTVAHFGFCKTKSAGCLFNGPSVIGLWLGHRKRPINEVDRFYYTWN